VSSCELAILASPNQDVLNTPHGLYQSIVVAFAYGHNLPMKADNFVH
jgi:hypothetical protein